MQVEPIRDESSRAPLVPERRRVRTETEVSRLLQKAERRRKLANAVVVGSLGGVGALVWVLYTLLTR